MRREIMARLKKWQASKSRDALVIYGARQIGKTYILKEFAKENFGSHHYLNFELDSKLSKIFELDLKPERIINELSLYLGKKINLNEDLIIFDEVQACPRAINSLKYFSEFVDNFYIAAAGSLLGLEFSVESFPVGKVEQLHMYPMRFTEFLDAIGDELSLEFLNDFDFVSPFSDTVHEKIFNRFLQYLYVGGMPKVVKSFVEAGCTNDFETTELIAEEQQRIIESVLADIAKHSGKENSMHIARTWKHIPERLSQEYDGTSTRFQFKGIIDKKKRYRDFEGILDWLEKASLVIKTDMVNSAEAPLGAYIKENIFKLYFYDIGILARLSDLNAKQILSHDYGTFKGFFLENYVAQELKATQPFKQNLISWREKDYELEFLLSSHRTGNIIPLEVKSGKSKAGTSFARFSEKYKPKTKIILSSENFKIENDTWCLPLYMPLDKLMERV